MGSALYLCMFMHFLLSLLCFYFGVANSSTYVHRPPCHDDESFFLLQFRQSFLIDEDASDDPFAYPKFATWRSHGEVREGEGSDCCSWDGVECDNETGHVIGLHLASSCLSGSINSSNTLFSLIHLQRLDLSDNDFHSSEIPSGIGQLSRLTSLNLSGSEFSGQIPSEILALSELVFLDLSGNLMLQLQKPSLRDLVQNLTYLKKLHLSQVNISSTIPHALANLSSLTSLFLRNCGLHGEFPVNIFQLPSLQYLNVWYNPNLIGHLPEFEEAIPLKMLNLRSTSFSGELPTSIWRLDSLTEIDIFSCKFTGKIPSSLANLTHLTVLSLSNNNFNVETLSWLGQLTKLTILGLSNVNLNGEIPYSFVNMNQLTDLFLEDNKLSGQIPSWLMNLTQLSVLYLGGNQLEGLIPSSLFELVNLEDLDLTSNYLNGTVELHMFSKLKSLTRLQLSGNRLSLLSYNSTNATFPKFTILGLEDCNLREFPDFLKKQDELEFLFLNNNNIHGSIPTWIWNISKETLGDLGLSGNFLTNFDQHPTVLPWSRLYRLELDSNMLQGPLPVPPPSTFEYSISGNKLTRDIPPLLCNTTALSFLDLSSNYLSGRIPPCMANFSNSLSILDLGRNNFDGPIPETCTVLNTILRVLDFSENQFQGQIPRSMANCQMLEQLVLGNNQIDDIFPFWLGALPQLKVLILRSNRFHGEIGSWHTNFRFPKLRIIDLSDNEFTGDLPSEYFQNWDAMKLIEVNGPWYMQANTTFGLVKEYIFTYSYMYSMTMTNKGMQRFYEKIPNIFVAIDFSDNNFKGHIPTSMGNLKGLHLLSLGGNSLSGHIPSSLGNLTQLESLDLSQNKLSGEIPSQLAEITFLEFFNVSNNRLKGPIPQGKQFATFSNASFDGNPGLCGTPLSRACRNTSKASPPAPDSFSQQGSTNGEFNWKFVLLMGYGSGLVIGISIGYCLTSWKHEWFVKTFGKRQRKWTRTKRMGLRS